MKTREIAEQIEKLPKEQKLAILQIIDLKTDSDMEKVIQEIKSIRTEIRVLYWFIGALGLLMSIFKFIG